MGLIMGLKILVIIVVALLFLLTAYKTSKALTGGKAFLYIVVEIVVFIVIGFGAQWAVSQSFIKVKLTGFRNTPLPSSEKLAVKGCVKNIGKYKASTVTLHVKVINNASGGSFSSSGDSRPQKLELDTVVAKNLRKGTTKCFNKRFKYPPYFKLANIRAHVSAN
jgi:hypothetical protein